MTSLNIQIAECHQKVKCFKEALQNQRATLGINGHSNLASIQKSAYLQDIGLGDDSDGLLPPWLADEKVCSGIRSLLELRQCEEEERHLLQERRALTEWFSEEWGCVQKTRQSADVDLAYELDCRALRLAGLCILWKRQLRGYPGTPNENWGASDEELHSMVQGGHVIYIDSVNEERFDGCPNVAL
ncbi:hypothetical protein F5J12DRAFT_780481 [Pisolithus orientalis]|uniref:uncharacterized protein n=1 Tax=Pisolithus orientalis TaxID=936130 RepID=UPI002224D676|nr:uncharacterized protein F5J12DRAFT_780481 [Pisolithus orientalis]KAI6025631.1 hypothetical protein F5J12DRAFT_780481 [Pisolithus orientalis]